jgi:hypothetical protein
LTEPRAQQWRPPRARARTPGRWALPPLSASPHGASSDPRVLPAAQGGAREGERRAEGEISALPATQGIVNPKGFFAKLLTGFS